mgnify:CR=1 FL=1|jgi:hypothetical protein
MDYIRMIKKSKPPWKDCEHLFTTSNITKLEFICSKVGHCIYKRHSLTIKPHSQRNGPVIWIVKDGKPVDMNKLIKKGEHNAT